MGLNIQTSSLKDISKYRNFRLDSRFLEYIKQKLPFKSQRFKDFLLELSNGKDISKKNYVTYDSSDIIYPTVNNITGGEFNYEDITFIDDTYKVTKKLLTGDLLISRSGTVGIPYVWDQEFVNNMFDREIVSIPSGYLIVAKIDVSRLNPKFVYYYLQSSFMKHYFYVFGVGKTQKNIAQPEILDMPIPIISKKKQDELVERILPIQENIFALRKKINHPLSEINKVFANNFIFDENLWKIFGKGMTVGTQKSNIRDSKFYNVDLGAISNSKIFRFSSRFHDPNTQLLYDILNSRPTLKVAEVLLEIKKGVQPLYDNEGTIPVVKIANMKNGYIDLNESEYINETFFEKVKNQASVKNGDVLLCCTGKVSLGKIDIYDIDDEAILSVDSYLLRIDENKYNKLFFVYFFRSILGVFQIERDYTGTTNQIHLYDSQILNFDIPDIPLEEQDAIVKIIKEKLDQQKEIEKQISEKQIKIQNLIEKEICKK